MIRIVLYNSLLGSVPDEPMSGINLVSTIEVCHWIFFMMSKFQRVGVSMPLG